MKIVIQMLMTIYLHKATASVKEGISSFNTMFNLSEQKNKSAQESFKQNAEDYEDYEYYSVAEDSGGEPLTDASGVVSLEEKYRMLKF